MRTRLLIWMWVFTTLLGTEAGVAGLLSPSWDPYALHLQNSITTIADGDTTPSVLNRFVLKTANTAPTTITDFDNGSSGQPFFLIVGDTDTTFDFTGTNLKGNAGGDYSANENDLWVFVYGGTYWHGSFLGASAGSGDITDVWSATSGNVSALTAGGGDSLDASLADTTIPWKVAASGLPTVDGQAIWRMDLDILAIGDGASTVYIAYAAADGAALTGDSATGFFGAGFLEEARGGTGAGSLLDLIILATHTTGNFVASITNGAGITGGDGGSEGAALIIAATLGTAIDTGEITDGTILEADLDATNAPGAGEDNYVLTYNHAGLNFTWAPDATGAGGGDPVLINTVAITDGSGVDFLDGTGITITLNAGASPDTATIAATLGTTIDTGEITDGTILEADLDVTNAPTDNYVLSYNLAGLNFTWIPDAGGGLTEEEVEDYVGGMLGGTETHIAVTYQDGTGDIDFVVDPDSVAAAISGGALADGIIVEADIDATNAPTDNYVLSYNQAALNFTWVPDATGGTTAYDTIGDPTGVGSISFDDTETATYITQTTATDFWKIEARGDFGAISIFTVEQIAGNPAGGVLIEAKTADGENDPVHLRLGNGNDDYVDHHIAEDGTYTINVTSDGAANIVLPDPITLTTPTLGTIASGVGTALTALNGENIQDDTIDDDSIDFADVTLADFDFQTAWRLFYSDTAGDVTELAFGSNGQYLQSQGAAAVPTWATPGGTGTMTTVEDGDAGVGGSDIVTLDFDGGVFAVTESPDTEINIDIADDGLDSQHYNTDSIDDEHINFGSGADQVDSDDVPEGSANLYQLTEEEVEDYAGGMLVGTETHIAVTYQDGTGDIDFVVDPDSVAGAISEGALADDIILEADLKAVDAAADEDILTRETTGGDFEWHSAVELGIGLATSITDGIIVEADLDADVGPVDGDFLQYDETGGNFTWRSASETLSDIGAEAALTDKASLEATISDVANFAEADGDAYTGVHDFGAATTMEVPNDESADATLGALGQIHIRGDEDRISYHMGAGGEVAGEVTVSVLGQLTVSFDPGLWYDSNAEVNLFPVLAKKFPNGIIIDYWECSCNVDPDVEINADLRYADAWLGLANAADIDEIDTTNGTSSEDTDANINGGAAVAAGKVVYLGFDADPEGTCTQMTFAMLFHSEED